MVKPSVPLADHLKGPEAEFGQLACGCHPNCGAAVVLVHNTRTNVWAPITAFFDLDQFIRDLDAVVDSARGRKLSLAQVGLSFLRNFDQRKAPEGFTPKTLVGMFNGKMGGSVTGDSGPQPRDWRMTSILSMWFQDLWITPCPSRPGAVGAGHGVVVEVAPEAASSFK